MATSLFHSVIFGPVQSRRLGVSLGVNLLPNDNKLCNFNCIYCECGWGKPGGKFRFNDRETVRKALKETLVRMAGEARTLDVITFAGNGEPTLHPEFEAVIDDAIALRDRYMPSAGISVLTNATMIGRPSVLSALQKVDRAMLKLDSGFDETVKVLNNPQGDFSVAKLVAAMKTFGEKLIVQTMFLRGTYKGESIDNTTSEEVEQWLRILAELKPCEVTMYTIDRETPAKELEKIPLEKLEEIAKKVRTLGIIADVY